MSFPPNYAAVIPSPGAGIEIQASGPADLRPQDILVKNHAWGINPVDHKMQSWGLHIQTYPAGFGCDVAGEVVSVGAGVDPKDVEVGDRVLAHPMGIQTKRMAEQAFQLYTIVEARWAIRIPDVMPYSEAAKLPLAMLTAISGLYNTAHLALPRPTAVHSLRPSKDVLLVWGGSSNVGAAAVQLAIASGISVVTIAGKANLELLRSLGVDAAFDRAAENVESAIVDHIQGRHLLGAFDAIGTSESTRTVAKILSLLGGGKIASTLPNVKDLPAGVSGKQVQATTVFLVEPDVGESVWCGWLPQALVSGKMRPVLKTKIIERRGLEGIQEGIDQVAKGVSGTKIVVLAE